MLLIILASNRFYRQLVRSTCSAAHGSNDRIRWSDDAAESTLSSGSTLWTLVSGGCDGLAKESLASFPRALIRFATCQRYDGKKQAAVKDNVTATLLSLVTGYNPVHLLI